jgi:peptide/nickel transport system substrate-binding protein
VQPEAATKVAAMQAGEMDWWENPPVDLLPLLRKHKIATPILDPAGSQVALQPNHLYPPFDKPAIRRALLGAIDQREFMLAARGEDTSLWSVPVGFFPPASPLASDAGLSVLTDKRDYTAVRRELEVAGYQGEKVVLVVATDIPTALAASNITADVLKPVGMNVDYQATDWGTVLQRRTSTNPPHEGGWNLFCVGLPGLFCFTPATHVPLRGAGKAGWFGWPDDPRMEELRDAWFNASDLPVQKKIGEQMQLQAFENVPYYPLGLAQQPTALQPNIRDAPEGFPLFWNARRT